ncbi:TonB-dependent receptor [Aliiglaciecola sp. CAU 1673]|uniref:outer membrane beta-barrel protein n=1 Tax=Aliiglaciecola sp. CAU 1673 TaxID=3032595 RepID=UPI0023DB6D87|nr:outer membrane beta-barrel protein [Aliiglaciecola sp. CAU 1673]MDF2179348.1 TonB-dependent receptor [Aliiglaciecola sp. CAU 1673]
MKKVFFAAAFFSSALMALPALSASPNWNQLGLSYVYADIDDVDDASPTGFGLSASALLGERFIVRGNYQSVSDDIRLLDADVEIELDWSSLAVGMRHGLTNTMDLYGLISYEYLDAKASFDGESESEDDNGYGLTVGLRAMVTEQLELDGSVAYVDVSDESDTLLKLTASYYLTSSLSVGLGLQATDDFKLYMATARYSF